jgi:hypothetical protein
VFATHFGRPLPRWADEGACTTVEHTSERKKQEKLLFQFLTTNRGIAFNQMFAMKEYPPDVLPLYAQGFSLARFLIAHRGKQQFIDYVGDGMKWNNWTRATREHYGFKSLGSLQRTWLDWVGRGQPAFDPAGEMLVASAEGSRTTTPPQAAPDTASSVTQLAAVGRVEKGSWYARTRDQAMTSRRDGPQSQLISNPIQGGQAVSRPQPPRQPEQRVIQWRHITPPSSSQQGYLPQGTFWR